MKYVITERQYKIITEQTDDIDWLINWFKKVPEEKLKRTFTTKDAKGKVWTLGRNEILKLLSSDNFVIVTDPSEKLQNGLDITPASYSPPSNSKYPGKILISGDWKKIIKTSPTYKDIKNPMGTVIHHEKIHNLQYQQADTSKTDYDSRANANNKSKWSKKISGFCKLNTNPFCKKARAWDITGYLKKPEEIYAHLFTIREYLGIQPMDIITNVNVFEILYCCNKSFKETLMYLHNTLANIEKPKDSESDVMV